MKCEQGFCINCEKVIHDKCLSCGQGKPNDNYTEVALNVSNGSKMFVAVCVDCKDDVFHADKEKLMAAVKEGWRVEARKHGRDRETGYLAKLEEGMKHLKFVD